MKRIALATIACLFLAAAGCARNPDGTINWGKTNANVLTVAATIGKDAVIIDCNDANLFYVLANDVNASTRVKNALAINSKVVTDACPLALAALNAGTGKIVVQTGSVVPAS